MTIASKTNEIIEIGMYIHNVQDQHVIKVASDPAANLHFHYDQYGLLIGESAPDGRMIRETVYLGSLPVAMLNHSKTAQTQTQLKSNGPEKLREKLKAKGQIC